VTPDIPSLGSSSAPNVLRVFDEGHLSIAAHQTLPGQMDYLGFNVGFGHFSEGFERPDIVELDVSVTLLPFHEIDGSVTAVAWDPITITLGPGPQPITECVFLENPGVGHPLFSTWLVDIVPRHVDGTPIHLPVGIDDLFYGCYPSAAGGCGSPWTGAGYDLITFAHREFQQDFYGIYVVDPDIGDEIPLLIRTDNRDLGEPAWSPDGRWIAYTERGAPASPDAATINLYVIGGDGTGPFQITSGGNVYGHDWSPDGTRLVYGYGADDDDADLWIVDALGGVPERLTDLGDDFGAIEPAWSPDGALIAFERGERIDGIFWQSELYVVDSGGGLPELAATVPSHAGAVNHMHSWSPDSTRILYASHYEDGGGVVWIVDFASGTEMSVSGAISEALTPVWSPTGDRVAFFGFSGGTGIWRVNADGSGLTELPADPEWGSGIAWSSDGGRLAYTGSDAETAIWVIGTDGSLPVRVTELFGHEVDPDWSP
jgi:Tol biopolymer transport system component